MEGLTQSHVCSLPRDLCVCPHTMFGDVPFCLLLLYIYMLIRVCLFSLFPYSDSDHSELITKTCEDKDDGAKRDAAGRETAVTGEKGNDDAGRSGNS